MKITIITSCYNREKTIRGCIESVLAQDYPDIEYIVVDGASKDGSLSIINEYKDRISKIISEPDRGMYEAINKGIRAATGDVIGLVHSDDFLYSPQTVSNIVKRFEETHADFLYGDGLFVNAENTDKVVRNWIGGDYRLWKVRHGWLPLHPTCYSVTYLHEYIVRMRMGGLSTDSARRKQMWKEDIRMYQSHGMNPTLTKIEKMMWKVPQFIGAKFK